MVLVDRKIRDLVDSENLIINYNESRLNSISYDVVIDKFILDNKEIDMEEYILFKNSFVYTIGKLYLKFQNLY